MRDASIPLAHSDILTQTKYVSRLSEVVQTAPSSPPDHRNMTQGEKQDKITHTTYRKESYKKSCSSKMCFYRRVYGIYHTAD